MKILLIEDETTTGTVLHRQLQAFGSVIWARSFGEAMTALASPFDLVVTDTSMPGALEGRIETVAAIASKAPGARVYAITSAAPESFRSALGEMSIRVFDKADLAPLIQAARGMVGGDLITREQAAAMIIEALRTRDQTFPDLVMTAIERKAKDGVWNACKTGGVLVASAMAVHYFGPIKTWAMGYAPWLSQLPWPR